MTEFNFKKAPDPTEDSALYRRLSYEERLRQRTRLASKRQHDLSSYLTALSLPISFLALFGVVFELRLSTVSGWISAILAGILLVCVSIAAGLGAFVAILDPNRHARAWKELFDYEEQHFPPEQQDRPRQKHPQRLRFGRFRRHRDTA